MKNHRILSLTLITLSVLSACSSLPANNASLENARNDYAQARNNPQTVALAPVELKQAGDALDIANAAWTRNDKASEVDHLAYLARQRVAIAQETAKQKTSDLAVTNANAARDKIQLAARTNEADTAQRGAEAAQRQSEASQRQSEASQQQARDAEMRASQLEAQLKELNAQKTDRGMVITIGDVLFDTNQAKLKTSGMRNVEKLVSFLNQYPKRNAMVEGFTDSIGTESLNQDLSSRRASAVRTALVDRGVAGNRVEMRGYGEAYPVATNSSADGRQLNRRVEIVLSEDGGSISPR